MLNVVKRFEYESIFEIMEYHEVILIKLDNDIDIEIAICSFGNNFLCNDTVGQKYALPFSKNIDFELNEIYLLKENKIIEVEILE